MKRCLSGLVQWLEDLNISDWWNLCKSVRRCRCMRWAWWSSGRRSGSHILLTRIVWKWKAKLSNMEVQHIDTNIRTMLYIYIQHQIYIQISLRYVYIPLFVVWLISKYETLWLVCDWVVRLTNALHRPAFTRLENNYYTPWKPTHPMKIACRKLIFSLGRVTYN